jgi:thymidylate synthase ThyX
MIYAKIVADSITPNGKRITTFELQYQRFIHGEVMTHRLFSRNAMSSRAIPVAKMIEQVRTNPATPIHWGKNQPGMQANIQLEGGDLTAVQTLWQTAAEAAADLAEDMNKYGAHKQIANRILEPFQWMRTLVTSTEWGNFFELRAHPDAQPEFHELALQMQKVMLNSTPVLRPAGEYDFQNQACWHLPYVSDQERATVTTDLLVKLSTARCARVSYLTHDGENPSVEKDLALYDRLVGSVPLHASPTEHSAMSLKDPEYQSKNFIGWLQYRQLVENRISK